MTYFIIQQLHIIERALGELQEYLARKADHFRRVELLLRGTDLNHRKIAFLSCTL